MLLPIEFAAAFAWTDCVIWCVFFCRRNDRAAYPPPQGNYAATAPPLPAGQAAYMPPQANYAPTAPPGYPANFDVAMNPPQPAQAQSRGDKAFLEGW